MIIVGYLFMCVIFGTTFLAIKVGVDAGAAPFFSAGMRFFMAGLVLFVMMVWQKKAKIGLLFRKEILLTGIGLTFGTFSTLYWAEQYVSSGTAAVLSATGPMLILLIQTFILKIKATLSSFIGCLVGMVGVFLLILPSLHAQVNGYWVLGCLVIMGGTAFYASGTLYSKQVIKKFPTTSPIALNAAQMMHGGILLFLLSMLTEKVQLSILLQPMAMGSLLYLIIFGSMVGHSLYYWLVSKTNPVFPATWLFVSPILALSLGVMIYHEYLSWLSGLGAFTIVLGTIIVHMEALKGLNWRRLSLSQDR
ncbi:DMT family transporter [Neobacillus jeddahensis]|uniref:DMT family transporter n=1 Tax=Neobacillus jeddahensis TaxID=1461580 RepID=UPI00058F2012|nr:EamA family transporter [Neobacillus jeddahensis]